MRVKAYVDCESTGLDRDRHHPYEIAVFREDYAKPHVFNVAHTLDGADPAALRIGRYHERAFKPWSYHLDPDEIGLTLARILSDVTIVAANARFDADMIRKVIGFEPWHYRLLDVEAYALGVLGHHAGWDEVPGLATIVETLTGFGHTIPAPDHTAGADAIAVRVVHETLTEIRDGRIPVRREAA